MKNINYEVSKEYFKKLFDQFDYDKNNTIEFEEFVKMMDQIRMRKELEPIFNQYKN